MRLKDLPSTQEAVVLQTILKIKGQAYGLQIARESGIKKNGVYALLQRLDSQGLVKSHLVERTEEGPPFRVYALTERGTRMCEFLNYMESFSLS
ncbi:MAG: helix-turn-helix transcriptional regulator [Candidatus Pacebacteria bacterium]|nr:helix-turn-helix transcriptional regulator [Candidatus Paceibacterota bacterium]